MQSALSDAACMVPCIQEVLLSRCPKSDSKPQNVLLRSVACAPDIIMPGTSRGVSHGDQCVYMAMSISMEVSIKPTQKWALSEANS